MAEAIPLLQTQRVRRLSALLAAFDRDDMEAAVEMLLAAMDALDGDTDREANGDELDGTGAEDDFVDHSGWRGGAGCPIADSGIGDGDGLDEDSEPDEPAARRGHRDRFRRAQSRSPDRPVTYQRSAA